MDLKTFITQTINNIVDGINDTKSDQKERGFVINPTYRHHDKIPENIGFIQLTEGKKPVTSLSFDIALTAIESSDSGINGEFKIPILNIGGKDSTTNKNENISRLKFDLNIVLPNNEII